MIAKRITLAQILFVCIVFIVVPACSNPDRPDDKSKMIPKNYKLFQGTEAWPLAKAIIGKDYESVDSLIEKNPSIIDIKDSIYGNSILMLTIFNRDYTAFSKILKHNPDINYHNSWNASPIYEASRYGDSEVRFIADLLENGANVNDTVYNMDNTKTMSSPLLEAAGYGNKDVINFLIGKGADVNFSNDFGRIPLGAALATNQYENAWLLLKSGADYTKPVSSSVDKKGNLAIPRSILQVLRGGTPDPLKKEFYYKKKIIKFLKERGLDYDSEPIPDYVKKQIKSNYGIFWRIYIKYY